MLSVSDVIAWLPTLGITTPVQDSWWVPPDPDRLVMVTISGGPGPIYERLFDRTAVTVRCRGLQRQPSDTEALAAQVDEAVMGAVAPVMVGKTRVNDIDRAAPPRFAGLDKAFRAEFVAVYLLTAVI